MQDTPLGSKNPHRSLAVGTAGFSKHLPLSLLEASDSLGCDGVAYSLGRKVDVFFRGS